MSVCGARASARFGILLAADAVVVALFNYTLQLVYLMCYLFYLFLFNCVYLLREALRCFVHVVWCVDAK